MNRRRLELAKPHVIEFFSSQQKSVYTFDDIAAIMEEHRGEWKLPVRLSVSKFMEFFMEDGSLIGRKFPFSSRPAVRFFWGDADLIELGVSLRPKAYISHYSAMHHHGLMEGELNALYLNEEQPSKPAPRGELAQGRIDAAFRGKPRLTSNCITIENIPICVISGKNTGNLGVITAESPNTPVSFRVTCLERTLIDAVVRARYAGGISAVAEAYKRASGKVSISSLVDMLKQLNYVYPYHQCIGFYLDYARCYTDEDVKLLDAIPKKYDFYLDYQMDGTRYSEKWKVYYPSYLDGDG